METLTLLRYRVWCWSRYSAVAMAAFVLAAGPLSAAPSESLEYSVKAAYLYKFGFFVEWPASAFSSPTSPLNLCIVGDDPFGAALDNAVSGQRVSGREVAVKRLRTVGRESGCHIVYLSGQNQLSAALRGANVLTVGDARASGTIINFVIKDDRVRFDIDDEAAAQNGLVISSKLLSLALTVKQRPSKENR